MTTPDPRPGDYFVSATSNGRYVFLAGPFPTHTEALAAVAPTRKRAYQIDHRAPWYAYGTARLESGSGKTGKFNADLDL